MRLVSVIIPCYKDSNTLARAIKSVLAQTYSPIEIIVVNDHSPETDQINQCVASFPTVKYHVNSQNIGLAATRNVGLSVSNGDIIAFLDADDEYHIEKIERQIKVLRSGMVVTCGLIKNFPNNRVESKKKSNRIVTNVKSIQYRNTLNGAGLLAEKSLLIMHNGYDTTLRSCEDYDLYLRLLNSGIKVFDLGMPLYKYYYNPLSLSNSYVNISHWEIEVIRRHTMRLGTKWEWSFEYYAIILLFLLRHLIRAEKINGNELRKLTQRNSEILLRSRVALLFFKLIDNSRIAMFIVALSRMFYAK